MAKELSLNCPYKVFKDTDSNYYFFDTDSGIRYIVYFTDSNESFPDFHLRNHIYSFGFEPQKAKNDKNKALGDNAIKETIIALIKLFFKDRNNVLTFVADISGLKQKARNRLFEMWKNEYDINNEYEKYNIEIIADQDIYFTSMIVHKDNIHKSEYKKAFDDSVREYEK